MASSSKAFSLSEGEAELGRRESILKKQAGHAIVTTKRLVWTPNGGEESKFLSLPFTIIRRHMASVAGSQHCLLKVMTEVAGKEQAIVFLFESGTKESDRGTAGELLSSALASQSSPASSSNPAASVRYLESQQTASDKSRHFSSASAQIKAEPTEEPAPKRRKITDDTTPAPPKTPQPGPPSLLTGTRKALYEQDEDLRDVYNQVVSTGIITDEEFWASRQALIKETERKMRGHADGDVRQRRGISSELATDLQPVKQEGGSVHFRLTPAIIHQIFVDHPAVHRAYKEYVPQKMGEKEFWTKYLQSQYFKKQQQKDESNKSSKKDKEKDKGTAASSAAAEEDMFARLTLSARDEQRELQEQVAAIDPTLNLAKELAEEVKDDDEIDYIEGDNESAQTARALVRRERERRKKSQQLIKRFNRHGQLVLDSFSRFDRDEDDENVLVLDQDQQQPIRENDNNPDASKRQSLNERALESRRQLFEEKTVIHDLEAPAVSSASGESPLGRNRSNLLPEFIKDDPDEITSSERKSRLGAFQRGLDAWNPGPIFESVISIDEATSEAVSKELFPMTPQAAASRPRSRDDSGVIVLDATEEDEVLQQLKGQLRTVNELLQHFWTSLHSQKPNAAEKQSRIADALRKHQVRLEETLFNFKTVEPIAATIAVAVEPIERALKTLRLTVNTPKSQR